MRYLLLLLLTLASASAQDTFVPFFQSGSGNNLRSSLIAYYAFEEAAGVDALDSSGNAPPKPLSVSAVAPILNPYQVLAPSGRVGNAKGYSGGQAGTTDETDYYKRTDTDFAFTGEFTIAGWVYGDWRTGLLQCPHYTVASRGPFGGTTFSWLISFDQQSASSLTMTFIWSKNGTATFSTTTGDVFTAGWNFFYVKRSGTAISIAVTPAGLTALAAPTTIDNGVAGNTDGALFNGNVEMQIGNLGGGYSCNDFAGVIDELGFWSRGLSICELKWLYAEGGTALNGGRPTFDTLPCATPVLP